VPKKIVLYICLGNTLVINFFAYADTLIRGASKLNKREGIVSSVDALLGSSRIVREIDSKSIVGYRRSLATGIKYKTGTPELR
jgi:hypothetical protein